MPFLNPSLIIKQKCHFRPYHRFFIPMEISHCRRDQQAGIGSHKFSKEWNPNLIELSD